MEKHGKPGILMDFPRYKKNPSSGNSCEILLKDSENSFKNSF